MECRFGVVEGVVEGGEEVQFSYIYDGRYVDLTLRRFDVIEGYVLFILFLGRIVGFDGVISVLIVCRGLRFRDCLGGFGVYGEFVGF